MSFRVRHRVVIAIRAPQDGDSVVVRTKNYRRIGTVEYIARINGRTMAKVVTDEDRPLWYSFDELTVIK